MLKYSQVLTQLNETKTNIERFEATNEVNKCTNESIAALEKSLSLLSTLDKDTAKVIEISEKKDVETGEYRYKESFRTDSRNLKELFESLTLKSSELQDKIKIAKQRLLEQEEREKEEKLKEKERIRLEKIRKVEEERRQREENKKKVKLKEEQELITLRAKIKEKQYKGNAVNRKFLALKHRVDQFMLSVQEKTKSGTLEEEVNLAFTLLFTNQPPSVADSETKNDKDIKPSPPGTIKVLKLLKMFYENITRHPDKKEYRKFNVQNEKFERDILSVSGSLEILTCSGFLLNFVENFNEETQKIEKNIYLTLEEPDIKNYDSWNSWYDTQKKILILINTKIKNM